MPSALLFPGGLTDQVKTWQDIFGGGPLAAFLGLTIIAVVTLFWMLGRSNAKLLKEKDDHAETIRTIVSLTATINATWAEQLRATAKAADLQRDTLTVLDRSVQLGEWSTSKPRSPP